MEPQVNCYFPKDSGLTSEQWEMIVDVFIPLKQVKRAVLFGSRALGTYRPNSDVDIVLIGDTIDYSTWAKIELELEMLPLPYSVDILLEHEIENQALKDHILRVGKPVFERVQVA